jgi:hypothetical protein
MRCPNLTFLSMSCCKAHAIKVPGVHFPIAPAEIPPICKRECRCLHACLSTSECPSANAPCGDGWDNIPPDVQHSVLSQVPFKKLAKLAPVCKSLHAGWLQRLTQRELALGTILDGTWPEAVTKGLSQYDTALPRDLIAPAMVLPGAC